MFSISKQIGQWLSIALFAVSISTESDTTVYRSVGEDGSVSFSDSPPDNDDRVDTLEIESIEPDDSEQTQQNLQDMRETTDRMVADRLARERHRSEIRKMQAETEARLAEQSRPVYVEDNSYYPNYFPYRYRGVLPRPPIHPPGPVQLPHPGDNLLQPGHDYPASLVRRHYQPRVREAFSR